MDSEEILFVPGLKKNLLSILALEDKGFRVTFMDGKALMWPKDGDMSSSDMIGVRQRGLYKLPGHHIQVLVHDTNSLCELVTRGLHIFTIELSPR